MTKNTHEANVLAGFSTKDLVDELMQREGVHSVMVPPHETYRIKVEHKLEDTGPAIILVITE